MEGEQVDRVVLQAAVVASGADVLSIGESQHSLEDVYVELIGDDEAGDR